MGYVYLLALLGGIACMLLLDYRYKLFFWHDTAIALLITVIGVIGFLVWDAAGIINGIFLRGDSTWATGIVLAPELPLEEPIFLIFLVLCTMVLYTGAARLLGRRRTRSAAKAGEQS